jgi:O-acetyl-ADP-ribose deacetylase (regulator of RNase III)
MIVYKNGDATNPDLEGVAGKCYIVHICNDVGKWGKGFVLSLSKRWSEPKSQYLNWYRQGRCFQRDRNIPFELGKIQIVKVEEKIYVVNMIAQHNVQPHEAVPIRYPKLRQCLLDLKTELSEGDRVCMPRIGTKLAGGKWQVIEKIILETIGSATVYDYQPFRGSK